MALLGMNNPKAPPTIKPIIFAKKDKGPNEVNIDSTNIEKKMAQQINTPALKTISVFLNVRNSEHFSIFVISNKAIPATINIMEYPKSFR
jgi:hypothetical protein